MVVKGDSFVEEIFVVFILVKVVCDEEMIEFDKCYFDYGFVGYKGYLIKVYFVVFE